MSDASDIPTPPASDGPNPNSSDPSAPRHDQPVRWLTVATFADPLQAHMAAAKLEAEDIPSLLLDEHVASLGWAAVGVGADVKLQVPRPWAPRAIELLNTRSSLADSPSSTSPPDPACPRCGSDHACQIRLSPAMILLSLLLLGLPLLVRRRYRCMTCGHTWQP